MLFRSTNVRRQRKGTNVSDFALDNIEVVHNSYKLTYLYQINWVMCQIWPRKKNYRRKYNQNYPAKYYPDITKKKHTNSPDLYQVLLCFLLGLRRTNIVHIICRLFNFIGGGRLQVPLRALFQARAGTWVEPPTFRKLVG